jgi:superfamily II DNA or RNA helicase
VTTIVIEKISEVYIRIFSDLSVEQEMSNYFTFEVPGAKFMPAYKARMWDGKLRLYDLRRKTLYAGLYKYVLAFAAQNDYKVKFNPTEEYPKIEHENPITPEEMKKFSEALKPHSRGEPIELRDYQLEAVVTAINDRRTVLVSPTGSGKSFIIYVLMRWLVLQRKKCLIVVPTTSLVEQLYSDFADYASEVRWDVEDNCQKIYSGFTKNINANVVISTWQSIYKQPKEWFSQFDAVFGDEAHQFKAKSLSTVMEKMERTEYRIGTTGTLDNKQVHKLVLEGVFGPAIKVTTTKALMDSNDLATLNIKCILLKYPDQVRKERNKNLYPEEKDFLVTNYKRNKFIRNLALATTGNTLVLFQYVEKHGIPLYEMIAEKAAEGRKVFVVHGGTETEDREAIRHIVEKEKDAIIVASYGTFSTGINIRNLHNIVFASPSKSLIRVLQSIGRGLRKSDTKDEAKLFDIADDFSYKSWRNHTLNHFVERVKIYTAEKFNYKIVEVDI